MTPPPLQGPHSYYEQVRQRAWRRYLSPSRFQPPGSLPLTIPDQGSSVQPRLLPFHADPAGQGHLTSTPGTTWPVSRHPPSSSRDHLNAPVPMPS